MAGSNGSRNGGNRLLGLLFLILVGVLFALKFDLIDPFQSRPVARKSVQPSQVASDREPRAAPMQSPAPVPSAGGPAGPATGEHTMRQGCEAKDAVECIRLAMFEKNRGRKDEALQLFERGCSLAFENVDEACDDIQQYLRPEQLEDYRSRCSRGEPKACYVAASAFYERDKAQARTFFSQGCSAGLSTACALAGSLADDAEGGRLARQCRVDHEAATCATAAGYLSSRSRGSEAVELLDIGCRKGDASLCIAWAQETEGLDPAGEVAQCSRNSAIHCLRAAAIKWTAATRSAETGFQQCVQQGKDPCESYLGERRARRADFLKLIDQACQLGNASACRLSTEVQK